MNMTLLGRAVWPSLLCLSLVLVSLWFLAREDTARAQSATISIMEVIWVTDTGATVAVTLSDNTSTDIVYLRRSPGPGTSSLTQSATAVEGVAVFTLLGLTPSTDYLLEAVPGSDLSSAPTTISFTTLDELPVLAQQSVAACYDGTVTCLLYTSPSPRDS